MRQRRAFTLVELMVVIGVILLLISIIIPTLNLVREQGKAVKCQSNLRQLWQGYVLFAAAHDNRLPGCAFDASNPDPDKRDWMQGSQVGNVLAAPQKGTLFPYVSHSYDIYRCPSLDLAETGTAAGPGGGSNGRFDYSAFVYVSGCRLDRLPLRATVTTAGRTESFPAPVIVEEESAHMNGNHGMEAAHSNTDTLSRHHRGGSYFAATDGSVQWIGPPWNLAPANNWTTVSPRGKTVVLGSGNAGWSWYERQ